MPKFISNTHNKLVGNYIERGYSDFIISPHQISILNKSGYIQQATLQIANVLDQVDDFLMTGAIRKSTENIDFIIFDSSGYILNMSEKISKIILEDQ